MWQLSRSCAWKLMRPTWLAAVQRAPLEQLQAHKGRKQGGGGQRNIGIAVRACMGGNAKGRCARSCWEDVTRVVRTCGCQPAMVQQGTTTREPGVDGPSPGPSPAHVEHSSPPHPAAAPSTPPAAASQQAGCRTRRPHRGTLRAERDIRQPDCGVGSSDQARCTTAQRPLKTTSLRQGQQHTCPSRAAGQQGGSLLHTHPSLATHPRTHLHPPPPAPPPAVWQSGQPPPPTPRSYRHPGAAPQDPRCRRLLPPPTAAPVPPDAAAAAWLCGGRALRSNGMGGTRQQEQSGATTGCSLRLQPPGFSYR